MSQDSQALEAMTLADLHARALAAETGVAFTAVRVGEKRAMLAVCVTGERQLAQLARAFDLSDDRLLVDWAGTPLLALVLVAKKHSGFGVTSLRDEMERRTACSLIAAEPCSISKLEALLGL